jgi:hypothetical protein
MTVPEQEGASEAREEMFTREEALRIYALGFNAAQAQAANILNDARGTSFDLRSLVADIRALAVPRSDARAALTPPLQGEGERLRAIVQRFLDCPEIADCAPEDKEGETHQLEHDARSALSPSPPEAGKDGREK